MRDRHRRVCRVLAHRRRGPEGLDALLRRADTLLAECARFGAAASAELEAAEHLDATSRALLLELAHEIRELESYGRVAILAALFPVDGRPDA